MLIGKVVILVFFKPKWYKLIKLPILCEMALRCANGLWPNSNIDKLVKLYNCGGNTSNKFSYKYNSCKLIN